MRALEAMADPTRLRIVELLAERELSAGELAAGFDSSRPAVSRHLRVLRELGLISCRTVAQRRIYRLEPGPLQELATWVERWRPFWANRLDALDTEVRRGRSAPSQARRVS
jgi:DNA-binding transcriptional ArsR family regulator